MDITKLDEKLSKEADVELKKLIYVLEPLGVASKQLKTYKDVYAVKQLAEQAVESADKILKEI